MTALRDILVVLDDTDRSDVRVGVAIRLAQQHDAHLTGISSLDLVTPPLAVEQPAYYPELDTRSSPQLMGMSITHPRYHMEIGIPIAERIEQIEAALRQQLRFSGLRGDYRLTNGKPSEAFASMARHADLVVLGQYDPHHRPLPARRQLIEDILMTAGRPILAIPFAGHFETIGTKVLIGWNNSREAARALSDSLPILARAASVTVLEAYPIGRAPATDDADSQEVVRHLAHHGINAEAARTVLAGISAPNALLNYAGDIGADLLVVGGYGHSRLREFILGGVTRGLLEFMTLPVLMSN